LYRAALDIHKRGLKTAIASNLYSVAVSLPGTSQIVEQQQQHALKDIEQSILKEGKDEKKHFKLPEQSIPADQILNLLEKWKNIETAKWKKGKVSGGIYHGGDELVDLCSKVYSYFALSNPLHADIFPYVRKMEAEVVRMTLSLFNGDEKTCGAMTSGGTESILMAIKSYRDWGRSKGIQNPNFVASESAHAAFDKASHYFGIEIRKAKMDQKTFKVDMNEVKRLIDKNTVALVGSAPQFGIGIIDPIEELGALALKHGIYVHVDACLGGFLLPFVEKLKYPLPLFDFRVPGVGTISADTHKYGYSPKGSSVVMFRSVALRQHMYFVAPDWPGGIYATPSTSGSRVGAVIAATWAALMANGEEGYMKCAQAIMTTAQKIAIGISKIPGLRVLGEPQLSVVAWATDPTTPEGKKINIYMLSDAMAKKEWTLNTLQHPGAMHICCTYMHRDLAETFLQDLSDSVQDVSEHPEKYKNGHAAIYGLAETIDNVNMVNTIAKGYLDALYIV